MTNRHTTNGHSVSEVALFLDFRPSGASAMEQLVDALRSTPYHRWSELRAQAAEQEPESFADAEELVRNEWSEEDVRAQIRVALTAAATDIVLAMPDASGGTGEIEARLIRASEALSAAQRLSPAAGLRSVA